MKTLIIIKKQILNKLDLFYINIRLINFWANLII